MKKLGARIFVSDKNSKYHLLYGRIVAEYDPKEFSTEIKVKIKVPGKTTKGAFALKKIGFNKDQVTVLDGTLPYSSRGDFYRAIQSGKITGEQIVSSLRALRDAGVVEINLPSNLN